MITNLCMSQKGFLGKNYDLISDFNSNCRFEEIQKFLSYTLERYGFVLCSSERQCSAHSDK